MQTNDEDMQRPMSEQEARFIEALKLAAVYEREQAALLLRLAARYEGEQAAFIQALASKLDQHATLLITGESERADALMASLTTFERAVLQQTADRMRRLRRGDTPE